MLFGKLDEIRFMFWCLIKENEYHFTKFGLDGDDMILVLRTAGKDAGSEANQAQGKYVLSHGG